MFRRWATVGSSLGAAGAGESQIAVRASSARVYTSCNAVIPLSAPVVSLGDLETNRERRKKRANAGEVGVLPRLWPSIFRSLVCPRRRGSHVSRSALGPLVRSLTRLGLRGLALHFAFFVAGCAGDAPLGSSSDDGLDDEPLPSSNGSDAVAPESSATAAPPGPSVAEDFIVGASERSSELTQVYNGETHLVESVTAVLRAESDDFAVYVQEPFASQISDATLTRFMTRLVLDGSSRSYRPDLGILPTNEAVFGELVRDGLPGGKQRLFVVDTSGAGDGYLCSWCSHPDLHLDGRAIAPLDGEEAFSIVSHELYHAIHRAYDADEDVWMDESLAEAAMTVNGYFTDEAWLRDFLSNPNRDWGPSGADVTTIHYGGCLAWGTYLWEQGGVALMQALTTEPKDGWEGLDAALTRIGDPLSSWEHYLRMGASLYLDDAALGFGFTSFDLPTRVSATAWAGSTSSEIVEPYGFVYYETEAGFSLTVDGAGLTALHVTDTEQPTLETLEVGRAFRVSEPGVLVLTARTRTTATLRLE